VTVSWPAVSAVTSIVGITLVVGTGTIALRQFREAVSNRQFQSIIASVQQLQSSSMRNVRWFLRHNRDEIRQILSGPDPLGNLDAFLARSGHPTGSPKSVADLRTSMAVLEFLGVLSLNDKIPAGLEQTYLAPTIFSYWQSIQPVVMAMRADSGDSLYLHNVEAFVGLAVSGELYAKRRTVAAAKRRELRKRVEQGRDAIMFRAHQRNPQPFGQTMPTASTPGGGAVKASGRRSRRSLRSSLRRLGSGIVFRAATAVSWCRRASAYLWVRRPGRRAVSQGTTSSAGRKTP